MRRALLSSALPVSAAFVVMYRNTHTGKHISQKNPLPFFSALPPQNAFHTLTLFCADIFASSGDTGFCFIIFSPILVARYPYAPGLKPQNKTITAQIYGCRTPGEEYDRNAG